MFAVTEPTALPMVISTFPSLAAIADTISSGNVVATLTIVAPIINVGTPDALAMALRRIDKDISAFYHQNDAQCKQNKQKPNIHATPPFFDSMS